MFYLFHLSASYHRDDGKSSEVWLNDGREMCIIQLGLLMLAQTCLNFIIHQSDFHIWDEIWNI